MAERLRAILVITDTGPLITLAAAERLDYILLPKLPVLVPDAVFYEAVRDEQAIGARTIVDWVQGRSEQVRVVPTETFANHLDLAELRGPSREKDLGERAALELVSEVVPAGSQDRALLIMEDDRALRRVLLPGGDGIDRMIPLTTRDLLEALQEARRIQSADEVYRAAEEKGRAASQRTILDRQHEDAVAAVRRAARRP